MLLTWMILFNINVINLDDILPANSVMEDWCKPPPKMLSRDASPRLRQPLDSSSNKSQIWKKNDIWIKEIHLLTNYFEQSSICCWHSEMIEAKWNSCDFIVTKFTGFVQILFKEWWNLSQWSIYGINVLILLMILILSINEVLMFQTNRRLFKFIC